MSEQQQFSTTIDDNGVEQLGTVHRGSRATIMYAEPETTEDLADEEEPVDESLLDAASELGDLDELPEDPEQEEEEFVEGSPRFEQFKSDFQQAFGLPLDEARELVQGLQQESIKRVVNEQKYELSAAWNVPITEVEQRLQVVKKLWDKLPPDKQQAYDTPKGAQVLYAEYQKKQGKKPTQSSTKTASNVQPAKKFEYTQKQIDSMDAATYSEHAQRIMVAYAQGKVKR